RSAEIFDPVTHTSQAVPWKMRVARSGHTATLLSDGRVLIIGGNPGDASMEIFNPPAQ
ncbi:MAG: kelch-like protein, partial [Deltaproteobacteria bacterium]|nr:kelch-like protein [Deltaproteobacteria bacterium]